MKKSILWLIIVIVVLAIIYVVIKGIEPRVERGTDSKFAEFDPNGITKLEIVTPDGEHNITLVNDNQEWQIVSPIEYEADDKAVERVFSKLENLKFEYVASENPEKQATFEVEEENGTHVKLYKGDTVILDFFIGKTDGTRRNTFIREANSNKVHAVGGNLSYAFARPVDQWRDRIIVNIPKNDVKQIQVNWNDTTVVYTAIDSIWSIEQDGETFEVHERKLGSIINAFSPLRTTKFQDEELDLNWKKPDMKIYVNTYTGTAYEINFLKKDDKMVYIKPAPGEEIFISGKYITDRFKKTLDEYKNQEQIK